LISSLGVGRQAHLPLGPAQRDEQSFAPFSIHPLPALGMESVIPRREYRQMENFQRLGTYAAGLAIADADALTCVTGTERITLIWLQKNLSAVVKWGLRRGVCVGDMQGVITTGNCLGRHQ
jgi:hypothetical protein